MKRIKINPRAVGIYLIGLFIVYLTGMSMSGVLLFIFYIYLLFPVISLGLLLVSYFRFRYFEHFSTEHPVKGQEVLYKLSLANEAKLTGPFVSVRFKFISPDLSMHLNDIHTSLKGGEISSREYTIKYPYRGIYKVGIEYIRLRDLLNWISLFPEVWFRTFYVYPRIVELQTVFADLQNVIEASGYGQGILLDHTLFKDLKEYRSGLALKHVSWKKFAATGKPFLKNYEKTSWPGVEIYLDLRRERAADHTVLEREDCSVEILVALVKYFLGNNIPTSVHAFNGRERYDYYGTNSSYFAGFYKSTINITFAGRCSPAKVFTSDMQDQLIKAGTIIFITHMLDPEVLELVSASGSSDVAAFAVINQSGIQNAESQKEFLFSDAFLDTSGNIVFVNSIDTIRENLEA
ncbi:MAG: DUF58 domain-containing protein [Spirochaetales bacterium]|nr:DUF58 domain-containing protein [Spirochaetales bacterium]